MHPNEPEAPPVQIPEAVPVLDTSRQQLPGNGRRRLGRTLWLAIGIPIGVTILIAVSVLVFSGGESSRLSNNAKCWMCGYEFRIPDYHRDKKGAWVAYHQSQKIHSCPRCDLEQDAYTLYMKYDNRHEDKTDYGSNLDPNTQKFMRIKR